MTKQMKWLLALAGVGALLILLNSFFTTPSASPTMNAVNGTMEQVEDTSDTVQFQTVEHDLENRLKPILEHIVGVENVDVMVTVESTEEVIVERNEQQNKQITQESDRNGGQRSITSQTVDGQVVITNGGGGDTPIVTKKLKPRIRGVLVVAKGVENRTVKKLVIEAIQRGLDVPIHAISVIPRKVQ